MKKIFWIVFGLLWISFGISLIKHPNFYDSRHGIYQNFSQIRWPLGGGFIFVGTLFLVVSFKMKNGKTVDFICPKCEKTVKDIEGKDIYCPKCGTKMEPLEGFYERHPDRKKG
ncbi:MAG TPA: TFIIB-type zinc ribbon-containing protein [Desulfobulbaceae bacterium]|nr:TFIIB-type zinc ribbon-containing protein [Desulfobulbaceae bacterium]